MFKKRIAVIGCGISSSAFYHFIDKNKFDIIFFEKARGSGGRMSSRRIDDMFFDQGASCFGAIRSEKFNNFIAPFLEKGIIKEWSGEFRILDGKTMQYSDLAKKKRLVCRSQSNLLIKEIISSAIESGDIKFNKKVIEIIQKGKKHCIATDDGNVYDDFDYVVSSAPAPQTLQIFPSNFCFTELLKAVKYNTTFVLMISLEKSKKIDFSHLAIRNSIISRISYENSKGGERNFDKDCFVANANNVFSDAVCNMDYEIIKRDLLEEFLRIVDLDKGGVCDVVLHRWLYANSSHSYNYSALLDSDLNLAAIGDYVKEPRVEMAFESGAEMAETINYLNESDAKIKLG